MWDSNSQSKPFNLMEMINHKVIIPDFCETKNRHNPTFLFDHSRFDLYFSIKCGQVVNVIYLKRYADMRTCCVDPWYRLLCGAHIGHNNHGGVGDWKILMGPTCAKDFNSTRSSNGELRLDVGLLTGRSLGLSNFGLKLNWPKLSSVPCGLGPAQSQKEAKHYNFSTLSESYIKSPLFIPGLEPAINASSNLVELFYFCRW